MGDIFFVTKGNGESLFKDRGSRFMGFAFHIESEEDIDSHIQDLKNRYHDARHYCFAWIRGTDRTSERANDDGEPSHSAGDPILGQIRSRELTNTLVVVIRYFGGTKLGVSGLINAYRTAASEALDAAGRKECLRSIYFQLTYSYDHTSSVMRIIKEMELELGEQEFTETCQTTVGVRRSLEQKLIALLEEYSERGILQNYRKIS